MATVEFSSNIANSITTGMMNLAAGGPRSSYSNSPILHSEALFYILQGVKPSSGLPSYATLTGNTLIGWGQSTSGLSPTVKIGTTTTIATTYTAASVTGTATWFFIGRVYSGPVVVQGIYGSVGAVGSGADLEIPSTSIVAGTQYRVSSLIITFPSSYSY